MQQSAPREPSELAPSGQIDQVKVIGGKLRRQPWGHFPIFAAAFSAALALSACASSEYMGIPLKPGAAAVGLQDLARRAQAGDKRAQLELGIRYEEGLGLPQDLDRALMLYLSAAVGKPERVSVYQPPIGPADGQVLQLTREGGDGLPAARARLDQLASKIRKSSE